MKNKAPRTPQKGSRGDLNDEGATEGGGVPKKRGERLKALFNIP